MIYYTADNFQPTKF